ncbi:MAG: SDR family NAD(P)-dependent oxidoreductase, partial [Planctomycetota bacterium]
MTNQIPRSLPRPATAVVTGASRGIGQAIAIELARQGFCHLVLHYRRDREGAESTATEVEALGCETTLMQGDLAESEPGMLVDQAFDALGAVDAWVNNAGADVLTGEAANWSFQEKLDHLLKVDLVATIGLSRLVASRLTAQSSDNDSTLPPPS